MSSNQVRYETTPDQLRYALAKLREMLQGHPLINSNKIRVRFSGYGESSMNITIRVYAKTQEWDEFHAIREDILLRIYDVITEAGTGFAFSSHTIYMGKDNGLDEQAGKKAMEQVEDWRRSGQLPFPSPSPERLESINDTLDNPALRFPMLALVPKNQPDLIQKPWPSVWCSPGEEILTGHYRCNRSAPSAAAKGSSSNSTDILNFLCL